MAWQIYFPGKNFDELVQKLERKGVHFPEKLYYFKRIKPLIHNNQSLIKIEDFSKDKFGCVINKEGLILNLGNWTILFFSYKIFVKKILWLHIKS